MGRLHSGPHEHDYVFSLSLTNRVALQTHNLSQPQYPHLESGSENALLLRQCEARKIFKCIAQHGTMKRGIAVVIFDTFNGIHNK